MVLHFVNDVASSYIVAKMKRPPKISPLVGGHTTLRAPAVLGVLQTVTIRGETKTLSGVQYASSRSTRALHNAHPLSRGRSERDGGLAESPVGPDLNERGHRADEGRPGRSRQQVQPAALAAPRGQGLSGGSTAPGSLSAARREAAE